MPELFQNQYRIKSARLEGYDYTQPAWYFITICTKDHKEYFSQIFENKVKLNEIGEIASKCWKEIPVHFPNTEIDSHIIMPNHIHGIVIINRRSMLRLYTGNRFIISNNQVIQISSIKYCSKKH